MAEKNRSAQRLIIILLAVLLVAVCFLLVRSYIMKPDKPEEEILGNPQLAYAEGTTVVRDPDALQNAVDEMAKKVEQGNLMLEYEAEAFSVDGENFSGYLANAAENNYDMYFDMYSDESLTDELYLSGLVRPGSAIEAFKLTKKLNSGDHSVYMVFTTVEDDLETIHSQVVVSMVLHVTPK